MRRPALASASRHRPAGAVPHVPLDPDAAAPLYEQLYAGIREQTVNGRLRPGTRIASTRVLGPELGISRFTVVTAIERLLAEGYLVARRGAGTFVVATLPEQSMRPKVSPATTPARALPKRAASTARAPAMSTRGRELSAVVITGPRAVRGEPRAFRPRRPALDLFPVRDWARLIRRQWRSSRLEWLDYGEPGGYRPLRQAIAAHINVARGLCCAPEQVIVTNGAQQTFEMLFHLLLDPGDEAWMEDPGYLDVRAALVAAGARLVAVPVDREGLDVAAGIRRAPNAKLAIVSPSHQYPMGTTLSATRRTALLHWARATGAWIVEDDYDCYFRFRGRPFTALQRFDEESGAGESCAPRVIYVGTFSKTMFPSLRLGYCVVPDALVDAAANARAVASRNSPIVDQAALAEFIDSGQYDRHLRRMRLVYKERSEAMQFSFRRELAGVVSLDSPSAGTHVIGRLTRRRTTSGADSFATKISRAAAERDLVVFPLSRYCLTPPERDALVLGYGGLTPRRIALGAQRLAAAIDAVTSRVRI